MRKGTAVCIVIMVLSFVLSLIFLFASATMYIASGTKEVAEHIISGDVTKWFGKFDGIDVDKDGVTVDLPGLDIIADDEGVDFDFLFIHVNTRDTEEEEAGN